jgi:predicted NUDIX family NTP pyrophosphohydrolase
MPEHSAGILLYRQSDQGLQVLLVHPGGPFWRNKDVGAWQIPKGKIDEGEELLEAAFREFEEELGSLPTGDARPLGQVRQAAGKLVDAFALEGDLDAEGISSTMFEMEWPPKSGTVRAFPEVDRAAWFSLDEAREKMLASQQPLLEQLERQLIG